MKSIGKNFAVILLTAIFAMACVCPAFADAGDVSLIPDVQNKSVTILGQLANSGGVNYIVNIADFSEDIIVFSDGNPPIDSRLFTTYSGGYAGRNADVGETIYFADTFSYGHYSMYIYYNEGNTDKRIIRSFFVIDENAASGLISNLNSAATAQQFAGYLAAPGALESVGIYDADIALSSDAAFEHAFNIRPSTGYDVAKLQSAINDGDVIYYLKNTGVESVTKNKALLGSSYVNDYPNLTLTEKTELDTLLKTADYTAKTLPEVFEDMMITAKIKSCTNRTDMQSMVFLYAGKLGINTGIGSSYYSIADINKSEVFNLMLADKTGFKSMADAASSFNTNSYNVLNTPVVSLGGGGGASSSQSSSGDILNPGSLGNNLGGTFNDIAGHFAQNDIIKLASLGIINGFADGSYRPYENVTRAQYAKLICTAFGITGAAASFADVPSTEWYAPYVNALSSRGIITGYDGLFYPNDNIKREDAALIINRVAKIFNINGAGGAAISFADSYSISPYAQDAVTELSKLGIMNGDGISFYPLSSITRGESAAVISRLYDMYISKGV